MSTLSSVSSSSASYASSLAATSSLQRNLYNLGAAIQNGNLTSAGSILASLMSANPQYAASSDSSSSSTDSGNSINQDFQTLADAISAKDTSAAKSAWAKLKDELAKNGISTTTSPTDLANQAVAKAEESMNQTLLSTLFGGSSSSNSSSLVDTLLGSTSGSSSSDSVSSLVSNWLTYDLNGTTSSSSSGSGTGSSLNTLV